MVDEGGAGEQRVSACSSERQQPFKADRDGQALAIEGDAGGAPRCTDAELRTLWQGHIVTTPDVLSGRPRIAGTRIGVDFLLDLLASGWTRAQVLDQYPHLKPEDLRALFAFVRDSMSSGGTLTRSTKTESPNSYLRYASPSSSGSA